jgi:hypothetical protein
MIVRVKVIPGAQKPSAVAADGTKSSFVWPVRPESE